MQKIDPVLCYTWTIYTIKDYSKYDSDLNCNIFYIMATTKAKFYD